MSVTQKKIIILTTGEIGNEILVLLGNQVSTLSFKITSALRIILYSKR